MHAFIGNVWTENTCAKKCFEIESHSLTTIHPHNEDPMSKNNKEDILKYMHGGVNVSGQNFSVGAVFIVFSATSVY